MWQMVVLDQLGRPANPSLDLNRKLYDVVGLRWEPMQVGWLLLSLLLISASLVAAAWLADAAAFSSCCSSPSSTLLALTPIWWVHYASFLAGPAALTVGAGIAQVRPWVRRM